MELTLSLTNKCQLACPWCVERSKQPVDLAEVQNLIEEAVKHNDLTDISFSGGGEPMLELKFLKKAVKFIKKHDVTLLPGISRPRHIGLITNGVAFAHMHYSEIIGLLKHIKEIDITLSKDRVLPNGYFAEDVIKGLKKVAHIILLKEIFPLLVIKHPRGEDILGLLRRAIPSAEVRGVYNSTTVFYIGMQRAEIQPFDVWTPKEDKRRTCDFGKSGLNKPGLSFNGSDILACCHFPARDVYPLLSKAEIQKLRGDGKNAVAEAVERFKFMEANFETGEVLPGITRQWEIMRKGCMHCKKMGKALRIQEEKNQKKKL